MHESTASRQRELRALVAEAVTDTYGDDLALLARSVARCEALLARDGLLGVRARRRVYAAVLRARWAIAMAMRYER